jgi:hypothetical protein
MRSTRTALLGAVAAIALLGAGTAFAQSGANAETRVIQVPKGAVVLVLPPGTIFPSAGMFGLPAQGPAVDAGFPFAAMPDAARLIRQMNDQMNEMMSRMQRAFAAPAFTAPDRTIEATLPAGGNVQSVVVTSFSDGHGTCTQRITYAGNGAAPKVEVSSTGNASCPPMHTAPVASPGSPTTQTWSVTYPAKPLTGQIQG